MELLANIYDPRIPFSVLMLQLGFHRASSRTSTAAAIAKPVRLEIAPPVPESYEEPERWDGLS